LTVEAALAKTEQELWERERKKKDQTMEGEGKYR